MLEGQEPPSRGLRVKADGVEREGMSRLPTLLNGLAKGAGQAAEDFINYATQREGSAN